MTPFMLYLHCMLYGFLCFGGGYMLIPFMTADLVNGRQISLGDVLGKVEKGFTADLAVLDPKSFKVKAVFLDGKRRI